MRKNVFANVLASLALVAASCSSDMPSIKRFEMVALLPILVIGLLSMVRRQAEAI
jgi:hypothetical protein